MKHVMLDIETFGNSTQAMIVSIGACQFEPLTGEIGETFHMYVDVCEDSSSLLKLDASTVIWWLGQSEEARQSLLVGQVKGWPLSDVLNYFARFLGSDSCVWGNGISFDCGIVKNAYQALGMETPWKFWNERDVRTLVDLGLAKGVDPKEDLPFTGIPHNALDDAIHQAKYVSVITQHLVGEIEK